MSSGRDVMMERWAEDYELQKERNTKQMSFEFDFDKAREIELNDYLDKTYGYKAKFQPSQFDSFFDTQEEWEDSRDTTPYNREQYEWND